MWFDSHCHVTADEFAADLGDVLDRAEAAGVEAFIGIGSGYGIEHNARAITLAGSDARVFATAAIAASFFLGTTFAVKSIDPIVPAQRFVARYFTVALPLMIVVVGSSSPRSSKSPAGRPHSTRTGRVRWRSCW